MKLLWGKEVADWLLVNLRQFHEFHYVDAAVPAFAPGHEVVRPSHHRGNFMLRQSGLLAGRNQTLQKRVVGFLELGGSRLSGFPGLRGLGLLHT